MIGQELKTFYEEQISSSFNNLYTNPLSLITTILDIIIVIFIFYKVFKMFEKTRAWQLLKGIIILILITLISGWLQF